MSKISENLKTLIQSRIDESQSKLSETKEWIEKLEAAGFDVSSLKNKQMLAEDHVERLRMLL